MTVTRHVWKRKLLVVGLSSVMEMKSLEMMQGPQRIIKILTYDMLYYLHAFLSAIQTGLSILARSNQKKKSKAL